MASPDLPRRTFASPVGPLLAELDADGALVSLGRARVELPGRPWAHPTFDQLVRELDDYFAGKEMRFEVPTAPPGSPFQKRVWAELARIPWGHMITYSELAARVGSNPRAVGQANGANPVAIVIPCHRVVGKDGSLVGYASGLDMKRALLKLERCILF
jgi:methylated-DNA-[protein]-cysteine S-methyltransferase